MRTNYAFLRMQAVTGTYPFPTSELDYAAHKSEIDAVMPDHGGHLQADGSWLQQSWKWDAAWAKNLKATAHTAGQLYIPFVGNDAAGILVVLDSPALQVTAANNLVTLMKTRWDAPWDGVMFDLEGIPYAYKSKLSAFLTTCCNAIRAAGFGNIGICGSGITCEYDTKIIYDDAYSTDYAVYGKIADFVFVSGYGYWEPLAGAFINRSLAPYGWNKTCIEYALSQGVPANKMMLGIANYSQFLPDSTSWVAGHYELTTKQAIQLATAAGVPVTFVESSAIGLVRESFAKVGAGHYWIEDGNAIKPKLSLANQYGLKGINLFAVGTGDDLHWQYIKEWRTMATTVPLTGITSGNTPATPVTVTAVAANPALFDSVVVTYTNPNTTGSVVLTPKVDTEADTTVTVTVNNGNPKNNLCTRVFNMFLRKYKPPTLDAIPDVTSQT
jgi:spore germination protein YaaH